MPFKSEKQRKWMHANEPNMAKKWEKEKKMKKGKVRELIKKLVREIMTEAKPIHHRDAKKLQVWKNHIPKAQKLLKKLVAKGQVEIDTKPVKVRGYIGVTTTKKMFDKVLDILMGSNIKVREGVNEDFAGAYPKEERASFDKKRQKQSEVLGYKLTGHPDVKTEIDDATVKENTMKISIKRIKEIIREELYNSQGEETDFKKGDLVKDINPDCPHHGSEGEVTKGGKKKVTYKVTNNGPTYKEGDELEKTVDQLVKLSQIPFADDHEETKKQPMGEAKKRDYKAEYKKYGSSTKSKKYRAELNKYNRQKGTYGNGDGKDASHKGGKIVGFEKESVNRGRAEKSRLKKEQAGNLYFEAKKESIFDVAARVLKNKSMENYKSKRGMVKLDMQTANLLVKVWKKINPKMKKILSDLGYKDPAQLVQTLWTVAKAG